MSRIFDALKQAELANRSLPRQGMNQELSSKTAFVLHEANSVRRLRSAVTDNGKLGRQSISCYLGWFCIGLLSISASVVFLRGGVNNRQAIENTSFSSENVPGTPSPDSTVEHATEPLPQQATQPPTEPATEQLPSALPAAVSAELPGFVLQVAAMKYEENADSLMESLRRRNFPVFVFKLGSNSFYRVAVGVYADAASAATAKGELARQGFQTILKPWQPDRTAGETASRDHATELRKAPDFFIR